MKYILTTENDDVISLQNGKGINLPGLGDNLAYSTLPELLHNNGHEFYIHTKNKYNFADIYRLVWKCNPYVRFVDDINEFYIKVKVLDIHTYDKDLKSTDFIQNIELYTGYSSGGSYPKIYYKPKTIDELKNKILIDLHSVTAKFRYPSNMMEVVIEDLKNLGYDENDFVFAEFMKNGVATTFVHGLRNVYYTKDLFEYCDTINSCKLFVCLHSGSYMLSHAIKNYNDILCYFAKDGYKYHEETGNLFLLKNSKFRLL